MANAFTKQTVYDLASRAVVKLTGLLDATDLASTSAVALADIDAVYVPTGFRILSISYDVSSQLAVQLLWDASTDVLAVTLTGQGHMCCEKYGGLLNNAGTGITGALNILTTGYTSGTQTFTIILELVKQGV